VAAAAAAAYAPVIVTLLPGEAALAAVLEILATPALPYEDSGAGGGAGGAAGGGLRGGLLVNLGCVSDPGAGVARQRCESAGMAYVQTALAGGAVEAAAGGMTAWAASADGPAALAAAEAAVLAPVCNGGGGLGGAARVRVSRLGSSDPRDAASPRAALLAELLHEQTTELEGALAAAGESHRLAAEAAGLRGELEVTREEAREEASEMASCVEAARDAMQEERARHAEELRLVTLETEAAVRSLDAANAAAAVAAAALEHERAAREILQAAVESERATSAQLPADVARLSEEIATHAEQREALERRLRAEFARQKAGLTIVHCIRPFNYNLEDVEKYYSGIS
jgi:hypothetical protein